MPYDTPSTAYGTLSYHMYDPFNSLAPLRSNFFDRDGRFGFGRALALNFAIAKLAFTKLVQIN
jgi:hypothetical protein